MHDDDNGSGQQGGWQPPEYVSPWIPASGSSSASGPTDDDNETISFGADPAPTAAGGGYGPQPGYGQQYPGGYGPPPGYGQYPWPGYGAPPPPPGRSGFGRALAYIAVAIIAAGAGAGAAIGLSSNSSTPAALAPASGGNSGSGLNPAGSGSNPYGGLQYPNGSAGAGGSNSGTGPLDASSLAAKVDPGIVDITSSLTYSGSGAIAEGTGMVISASGLVLTNNHVIEEGTSVSATIVTSGKQYPAKVIGYDASNDVALLQLVGASGLKTVTLGNSSTVKVGEDVLALGNAGGEGGLPSTAQGTIQALDQSIQASDEGADNTENLTGMIESNAPIEQGDSGGPLVNSSGDVIGMDTAANSSSGGGGYGFGGSTPATTAFSIPINTAISIADQINSGTASANIHIGLAGFLGVNVSDPSQGCGTTSGGDGFGGFGNYQPAVSSGALICSVFQGAPAAEAGLAGGDVITSVNGTTISDETDLTNLTAASHPGDKWSVEYVDQNGGTHTADVTLTGWAK